MVLLSNGKVVEASSVLPTDTKASFTPLTTDNSGGQVQTIPGTNLPVSKPVGIDLVTSENNSDKVITIKESSGGNSTTASDDALVKPDGTPGMGSDAVFEFNLLRTEGGADVNGSTTRPPKVGLGHEVGQIFDVKIRDAVLDQ